MYLFRNTSQKCKLHVHNALIFLFLKHNQIKQVDSQTVQQIRFQCQVHVPNFGGCQGQLTGVAMTAVSNSLILGVCMTKDFENADKNRGWKGG